MNRRRFCALAGLAGASAIVGVPLAGCRRGAGDAAKKTLTLYCSADADLAEPIIAEFSTRTGISVETVFDTEATKTTGLVNRLIGEKASPRADVWWSSEPFGTIRLASAGVLTPYRSAAAEASMAAHGGWPAHLREARSGGTNAEPRWYAFGSRLRVIAVHTKILNPEQRPKSLDDLASPTLRGRVGMARPAFGTTRGHMAALLEAHGEAWFTKWLEALKSNDLRLFDGNAGVVRAIGTGQIHAGLTDSDDVFSGQRQGWPVDMAPKADASTANAHSPSLLLPNTVAIIASDRDPAAARLFVDELLSLRVQEAMAKSESRNVPVDPALATRLASWSPRIEPIDLQRVAAKIESAMELCDRVLGA